MPPLAHARITRPDDSATEDVRERPAPSHGVQDAMRAFRQFDLDHQGRISCANLQVVARELGETMTDEEIEEMITAADLDKDGFINEAEFMRILKKGVS